MSLQLPRPRKQRKGAAPFDKHVPGVHYGVLDELAAYSVRRAQIAIYEQLEAEMAPLNITPPRFSSLVLIEGNPGILQTELARVIGVGRPAMVAIIDFLESQGWLRREAADGDRRANCLALTPKGRAHLARARERIVALDKGWTSALSAAERRTLMNLLDRVQPPRDGHAGKD